MICDTCANYTYDEEYEYYVCEVDLDEDEMLRFLTGNNQECPYYQSDDEYKVVRHHMQQKTPLTDKFGRKMNE